MYIHIYVCIYVCIQREKELTDLIVLDVVTTFKMRHIHICVYICMYVCMYIYIYMYVRKHIFMKRKRTDSRRKYLKILDLVTIFKIQHKYINDYEHACIHTYIHACIYIYTCMYAYTHTHTHTHTHS